ncbi:MAG: efflux RND transporter periplasmic adaptor subunit [Geobacter sp.]|nr:efflux RND transporter periplasmic adaptor subunit [Geobacter sp.]
MPPTDLSKLKIEKESPLKTARPRKKRLLIWVGGAVALAVVLLMLAKFFAPAVEVETVTVSQVYPSQTFTLLNASGYVVAQRKAAVASKTTGRLEWLGVEEGSRVKAGQVLARLENQDAVASREQAAANLTTSRHNLEQAKAELHDAELAYNRQKSLVEQGIVARAEYDAAEARFRKAKAAVAAAESSLKSVTAALRGADVAVEYTLIRAPFDGVVLTKNADLGDIVTPIGAAANAKAAVVTMADLGSLQVEVDVSESNLVKVTPGQPCEIQLDALPDSRFRGVVHIIVPTADRSKATVMVKVRFLDLDPRILPEMSAKVAFLERPVAPAERKPRTAVNPVAVAKRDGKDIVFVVRGDRVAAVPVTLGPRIGESVEVTSGVKAGERIVLRPLDKLKDGRKIKTAEK